MFSPLNDPQLEQWFQRFNAALKRLPAEERAELHQEVRQHLDALAAANEELGSSPEEARELALTQFGDPKMIGERLFQECQEGRSGLRLGGRSIGLGMALYLVCIVIDALRPHSQDMSQSVALVNVLLAYGSTALASFAVGRKYPFHAVKGAFYACLFWGIELLLLSSLAHNGTHRYDTLDVAVSLSAALWISSGLIGILINCGSAYLASVTKRGWYKPSLADFRLTLPPNQMEFSTWKALCRRTRS